MTIEANACIVPTGYEETNITECRVYFSICKVLSETICPGHTNSSTCLVVNTNDGNQSVYSIGDYQNANEFEVIGAYKSRVVQCYYNDKHTFIERA